MVDRRVEAEVFVEPDHILSDRKPLRRVGLRSGDARAIGSFATAHDSLIVIAVAGLSTWAFVAMVVWAI